MQARECHLLGLTEHGHPARIQVLRSVLLRTNRSFFCWNFTVYSHADALSFVAIRSPHSCLELEGLSFPNRARLRPGSTVLTTHPVRQTNQVPLVIHLQLH